MLTMDVNRTYLVLNSCSQFPARRALQGDSVIAIILFCEAYSQKLLCVQSVCTRTTAVRTGHVWFHIDMNTQDGGTNRYQVPGLLAIFRRKNRSREPLYTELTVLLTASSRKSQSASIFRCTSVLPLRLLIEWWQIIDKSYSGVFVWYEDFPY